jgi:hypothetical protein
MQGGGSEGVQTPEVLPMQNFDSSMCETPSTTTTFFYSLRSMNLPGALPPGALNNGQNMSPEEQYQMKIQNYVRRKIPLYRQA